MYQRLKGCKTLKEIYTVLGTKSFEKGAFILLVAWCMLPLFALFAHVVIGITEDIAKIRLANVVFAYKLLVEILGKLSVLFVAFYLIGRLILGRKSIFEFLKKNIWHMFLLCMLLHSCISTALSDDVTTSFYGTEYRFDGLLTYFFYAAVYVLGTLLVDTKKRQQIAIWFTAIADVIALLIILQDRKIGSLAIWFMSKRSGVFFHFNHAGYYLNLAIVCTAGIYLFTQRKGLKIYSFFSMVLLTYAILVNSTLGSFLASFGAVFFLMLFYIRRNSKITVRIFVPLLIMLALSVASYFGFIPTSSGQDMAVNVDTMAQDFTRILENEDVEKAGHGRVVLWKKSLSMIPGRPIFGYGPEQLDSSLRKGMWVDRPDNELIQHAVFLGIPGLAYYLIALITLFIKRWKELKELDAWILIGAGCVIAYVASSLLGNTMFYTTPYFYLFLGLVASKSIELE